MFLLLSSRLTRSTFSTYLRPCCVYLNLASEFETINTDTRVFSYTLYAYTYKPPPQVTSTSAMQPQA